MANDIKVGSMFYAHNHDDILSGKISVIGFGGHPGKSALTFVYSSQETDAEVSLDDLKEIDPDGILGTVLIYKLQSVIKRD